MKVILRMTECFLGTLSKTVVAPSDYEGSTSSSTSDEVDDVAMLDDSLDSLSDGASPTYPTYPPR